MIEKYRPLVPVDPSGLDDIAASLLNDDHLVPDQSHSNLSPAKIAEPEKYIILPSRKHGSYSYPDLLVAMDRSHQGKDWYQAHQTLASEGNFMLTIRQYADFLSLLKSGKVLDGRAKSLTKKRIETILDDILTVREPWRGEWLDADFKVKNGALHINYGNIVDANGKVTPKYSEKLLPCIMENKDPGIDLLSWLSNANQQGLPTSKVKDGSTYYYYPLDDNNSVARFSADSDWSYLFCNWNPTYAYSSLGVRVARKK